MLDTSKLIKKIGLPSVNKSQSAKTLIGHHGHSLGHKMATQYDEFGLSIETKQLDPINIESLDLNKNLDNIDKLFEFLLISLSQCLKLQPKNTVTFFAHKAKILGNLIIKGLRKNNDFSPISEWFAV